MAVGLRVPYGDAVNVKHRADRGGESILQSRKQQKTSRQSYYRDKIILSSYMRRVMDSAAGGALYWRHLISSAGGRAVQVRFRSASGNPSTTISLIHSFSLVTFLHHPCTAALGLFLSCRRPAPRRRNRFICRFGRPTRCNS